MSEVLGFILKFIKYIVDGISVVVTFLATFVSFVSSYFSVLPSEVSGVIIILFFASVFIVIFKAVKA